MHEVPGMVCPERVWAVAFSSSAEQAASSDGEHLLLTRGQIRRRFSGSFLDHHNYYDSRRCRHFAMPQ